MATGPQRLFRFPAPLCGIYIRSRSVFIWSMSPILGLLPRDVNVTASRPNNTGVVPLALRLSADELNGSAANSASASQSQFQALAVSSTSTPAASVSATTSLAGPLSPLAPPAFPVPSVSGPSTAGNSSVSIRLAVGQEPSSSSQATSSTQSSNIQQPSPALSPSNAATSPVSNGSASTNSFLGVVPSQQSGVTATFTPGANSRVFGITSSTIGVAGPSSLARTNLQQAPSVSIATTSPMAAAMSTALPVFPPVTSSSLSRFPSQSSASTSHVAIAGGVAGGVLLASVLAVIWFILRRRVKLRSEDDRMSVVSHSASMLSQATSLAWIRRPARASLYDPSSDPHVADPFRDEMRIETVYQGSSDEVRSVHSYAVPPSLVPGGVH